MNLSVYFYIYAKIIFNTTYNMILNALKYNKDITVSETMKTLNFLQMIFLHHNIFHVIPL